MFSLHIDIHGQDARATTLHATLSNLLERLYARDPALPADHLLSLRVTDDLPAIAGPGAQAPLQRTDAEDGYSLILSAAYAEQALTGDAEQVLELVHLLHRELWRGELAREQLPAASPADAMAAQFTPIVARMFDEYRANRASAWSLPTRSDLLLPHLLGLLQELPGACDQSRADYQLDGDLDALTGLSLARLALLMQTAAFSLGYLAGLRRSVADIAPELKDRLDHSLLGSEWPRMAALLAGAADSEGDGRSLQLDMLRTRLVAIFAGMGLGMRSADDGAIWIDVAPASAEALARATSRLGTADRLN